MQNTNKFILFRTLVIIFALMLAAACSGSMNSESDRSNSRTTETGDTGVGSTDAESGEGSSTKEDSSPSKGESAEPVPESERRKGGDRRYSSQQVEVKPGQLTAGNGMIWRYGSALAICSIAKREMITPAIGLSMLLTAWRLL